MTTEQKIIARIKAMDDGISNVTGLQPEDYARGLNPLQVMSAVGRSLDSVTGAPTRAAIGAYLNDESPTAAFGRHFGADPDLAPDLGWAGNILTDPTNLMMAAPKALGAAATAAKELGEVGAIGPNIGKRLRAEEIKKILDQVLRDGMPIGNDLKKFGSGSFNDVYDTGANELLKIPKLYGNNPQNLLESIPKRQVLVDNNLSPNFNFGLKSVQYSQGEKRIIPYVVEEQLKYPYGISKKRFDNFLERIGQTGLEPEDVTLDSHWHGPGPRNFGLDKRGMPRTYDPDLFEWHGGFDKADFERNIHESMPRYIRLDEQGLDKEDALKYLLEKIKKLGI